MNCAARGCHVVGNLVSPAKIVLGLLVSGGVLGGSVHLVKCELGGIVVALKHVEADVAGLLAGIIVIIDADLFESLNALGLYVNKNKSCKHFCVSLL